MSFQHRSEAAGYLGSMIDGEGSVIMPTLPTSNSGASVVIVNTTSEIIAACCEAADILALRYRVRLRRKQNVMVVCFSHWDDFRRLLDELPIRSPEKRARLETLLARRRDRRKFTKIDPDELRRLYVDEKRPTAEIGLHFGVHPAHVATLARRFGIPTRTHGDALRIWHARKYLR